jgi:hypothetical protein
VLKLDCDGKIKLAGRNWTVSLALAGERVQLEQIDERVLVFYCRTGDPGTRPRQAAIHDRGSLLGRRVLITETVKDVAQ